jgi:hypothetical protein
MEQIASESKPKNNTLRIFFSLFFKIYGGGLCIFFVFIEMIGSQVIFLLLN